jgi:formyl-CoA transferase
MGAYPMHHVVPRLGATPGSIRTPRRSWAEHNRAVVETGSSPRGAEGEPE